VASGDVEQGVGQGQVFHRRQVAVDDEAHRHLDALARLQHLLGEAEALGLVEVRRRLGRGDAGDGLGAHRALGRVAGNEDHLVHRTRVDLDLVGAGVEVPAMSLALVDMNCTRTERVGSLTWLPSYCPPVCR
jgi:hypothetical protein